MTFQNEYRDTKHDMYERSMSFLINVFVSATLERHRDYRHDVIAAKVAVPKINHHRHQTPQQKGIIYRSLFLHAIQKRLVDSKQKFIVRNCKFMPSYRECLVFSPASLCFPERPIHLRLQFKIKALIMVRVARFHAFAYRLMFYINFAAISVFIRSECITERAFIEKKSHFSKRGLSWCCHPESHIPRLQNCIQALFCLPHYP